MGSCFFASDLHGRPGRYGALLDRIAAERPDAVFLGGDLLPHGLDRSWARSPADEDFVTDFLAPRFAALRDRLGEAYPRVLLILGNDDPWAAVEEIAAGERSGLWEYLHGRGTDWDGRTVFGYNCVPPTPFLLKDWERYDVSRYVDPGCVAPEDGVRGDGRTAREVALATIRQELLEMTGDRDLKDAILLMHCPPYDTMLDRAALDGKSIDHVPLDPHVGSVAVRELIETRQPLLTLHGHVHESATLTGAWRERSGRTWMFNGAHEGPELALIRFDAAAAEAAERELVPPRAPD